MRRERVSSLGIIVDIYVAWSYHLPHTTLSTKNPSSSLQVLLSFVACFSRCKKFCCSTSIKKKFTYSTFEMDISTDIQNIFFFELRKKNYVQFNFSFSSSHSRYVNVYGHPLFWFLKFSYFIQKNTNFATQKKIFSTLCESATRISLIHCWI